MKKPYLHRRREHIQPSFPNNRLSTRPRKRKETKQEFVEEEFTVYKCIPDSAVFTPWDIPNPTDNAPSFANNYSMWYSELGGYLESIPELPELFGLASMTGFGEILGLPGVAPCVFSDRSR